MKFNLFYFISMTCAMVKQENFDFLGEKSKVKFIVRWIESSTSSFKVIQLLSVYIVKQT